MAAWMRAAIELQPDFVIGLPGTRNKISLICAEGEESIRVQFPEHTRGDEDSESPLLFHPCWNYCAAFNRPIVRIPDSRTIAPLRVAAAIPGVRRLHITSLKSAGAP